MTTDRQQNWAVVKDREGAPLEVQFQEWRCHVVMEQYAHQQGLSLRLVDAKDGSSIARATANVAGSPTQTDEVLIRNYSENAGILDALATAGLLIDTGQTVHSEFATLNHARLTPLAAKQWDVFRDRRDSHRQQQRG